jgi:hypothetical protein
VLELESETEFESESEPESEDDSDEDPESFVAPKTSKVGTWSSVVGEDIFFKG